MACSIFHHLWVETSKLIHYCTPRNDFCIITNTRTSKTHPERMLGRRNFSRFCICFASVSINAFLPSLDWGALVSMDFKFSISALHAVSNELSAPREPEWAAAIDTDWPIKATHGTSDVIAGPWPTRSAWAAARLLESEAAWSTLLITPTVLRKETTLSEWHFLSTLRNVPTKISYHQDPNRVPTEDLES